MTGNILYVLLCNKEEDIFVYKLDNDFTHKKFFPLHLEYGLGLFNCPSLFT